MERMGTEYQIFNGKEYVSLKRFWNIEGKYKTEKAKNGELEEENKNLNKQIEQFKKGVKAGTKIIEKLEEENKKLREENKKLKEELSGYKK